MAKPRKNFSDEYKWQVKDLFPSDELYLKEYETIEKDLMKYEEFKGHILDSANNLYKFLTYDSSLGARLEKIYIYAHIQNDQDTTDTYYQTMYGKAVNLYQKYTSITSFVTP